MKYTHISQSKGKPLGKSKASASYDSINRSRFSAPMNAVAIGRQLIRTPLYKSTFVTQTIKAFDDLSAFFGSNTCCALSSDKCLAAAAPDEGPTDLTAEISSAINTGWQQKKNRHFFFPLWHPAKVSEAPKPLRTSPGPFIRAIAMHRPKCN